MSRKEPRRSIPAQNTSFPPAVVAPVTIPTLNPLWASNHCQTRSNSQCPSRSITFNLSGLFSLTKRISDVGNERRIWDEVKGGDGGGFDCSSCRGRILIVSWFGRLVEG